VIVEKALVLRLDRPVTLAGCVLKPFQIKNFNVSTPVANTVPRKPIGIESQARGPARGRGRQGAGSQADAFRDHAGAGLL
jgi:hypothetical protein